MESSKYQPKMTDNLNERIGFKKRILNSWQETQMKVMRCLPAVQAEIFYDCPECPFRTKHKMANLRVHINRIHRRSEPWKCPDCPKEFPTNIHLKAHQINMHSPSRDWSCDCCGALFSYKSILRKHMLRHLLPKFACGQCDRMFTHAYSVRVHEKLHEDIRTEKCKLCDQTFKTKSALKSHTINRHFVKLRCEVAGCLVTLCEKKVYKRHLKTMHKDVDQVLIAKLVEQLVTLKPDYVQMQYVQT